jgi:SulP family sulfate permease
MWIFKMWKLVDFLSHPVIIGFTNAAAIVIWASQLNKIFWLKFGQILTTWWILETAPHKYEEIINIMQASVTDTHVLTLLFWIWSIFILMYLKSYFKKLPGVLIVVVIFTLLSWYFDFENMWGSVVWSIPAWLPSFDSPLSNMSWSEIKEVLWKIFLPALTIAILWFAEAISVAKAMASQSKQGISANKELIGQWLANIVASVNHGYAASWSFSRSAVNFSSGAKTGFSSVVTWSLVALTLLFLTPLLYHLPQATLAAVIIIAVAGLIKVKPIIQAWQVQKHDGLIAIIVFVVTLISAPHLEKWLIIWVWLSLVFFIYRSMSPRFIEFWFYKDDLRDSDLFNLKNSKDVWVYWFQGSLYFANAWYFEGKFLKAISQKQDVKLVVLDLDWVNEIDASWLEVIENLVDWFSKTGIKVLFARIHRQVYKAFERSWYLEHFWEENIFLKSRHSALEYAKDTLKMDIDIEPFYKEIPDEEKAKAKWIDLEIWFKWKIRKIKRIINKIRQKDLD